MAKSKDKKKRLSEEQKHMAGVVDFTIEDVRSAQNKQDSVNAEAYDLVVDAMSVSANYMDTTISDDGTVQMDDVYPTSLEETLKMDELLDKSERAVKDENDEEYNRLICTLRGIVGWSRRRHFNFSWWIILGTIITVVAVMRWSNSDKKTKEQAKVKVENIKKWSTDAEEVADWEQLVAEASYGTQLASPTSYKAYKIKSKRESLEYAQKQTELYTMRADTATISKNKKNYKALAKDYEKKADRYQKDLDKVTKWSLKDAKKDALRDAKAGYKSAKKAAAFSYILMVFFILLIPLYVIANYAWGYNITKHREEQRKVEGIRKVAFGIAGALFGAGLAMDAFDTYRVRWSDGSRTTETEANWVSIAFKAMLYALAIIIVAIVSTVIMIYSTISGFRHNYDFKAIIAEAKAKKELLQNKVQK